MSANTGGTFYDLTVLAQAMKFALSEGFFKDNEQLHAAEKQLAYLRSALWHSYPELSEAYFDKRSDTVFPIDFYPPETIEKNLQLLDEESEE